MGNAGLPFWRSFALSLLTLPTCRTNQARDSREDFQMAKIAFLGMGVMGYPMAGHLKTAGHDVTVYNRTASKAEAWAAEHGGSMAATPREAAQGADFVMACVGNDDDLRMVCTGENGAFSGMSEGTIFVDHTTVSEKVTTSFSLQAKHSELLSSMRRFRAVRPGRKMAFCRSCAAGTRRPMTQPSRLCRSIPRFAAASATAAQVSLPKCATRLPSRALYKHLARRCISRKGGARWPLGR